MWELLLFLVLQYNELNILNFFNWIFCLLADKQDIWWRYFGVQDFVLTVF